MDTLRWILLLIGALFVVGVYLWSRRSDGDHTDDFVRAEPGVGHPDHETNDPLFAPLPKAVQRPEPALAPKSSDDDPDLDAMQRELSSLQALLEKDAEEAAVTPTTAAPAKPPATRAPAEEKLIAMYVVAPAGQPFGGPEVLEALNALGLRYAEDMHIYHRYPDDEHAGAVPVFGIANLVEPGTLEPDQLNQTGTPGLTLFLQLPGPLNPVPAFDLFAATGQQLAERLQGELRDKSRNLMSRQILEHLRDDVQQYERRLRLPRQA